MWRNQGCETGPFRLEKVLVKQVNTIWSFISYQLSTVDVIWEYVIIFLLTILV